MQSDLNHLKKQLKQKQKTINGLIENHEQDRQNWERDNTVREDECGVLSYELLNKKKDLSRQGEMMTKLEIQVQTLQGQIKEHEEKDAAKKDVAIVEDIEKKISYIMAEVNSLKDIVKDKHGAERDLKDAVDATKDAVDGLKGLAISVERQGHALKAEVGELNSSINQMTDENQEIKSQLNIMQTQLLKMNENMEKALQKKDKTPAKMKNVSRNNYWIYSSRK